MTSIFKTCLIDEGLNSLPDYTNKIFDHHGALLGIEQLQEGIRKLRQKDPDFQKKLNDIFEKTEITAEIKEVKNRVGVLLNRYILINTQDLNRVISISDKEVAFQMFLTYLMEQLSLLGVETIDPKKEMKIEKIFMKDFENNDVPIFYVDNKKNIYYYDIQLANIPKQRLIKTINFKKYEKILGKEKGGVQAYKEVFEKLLKAEGVEPQLGDVNQKLFEEINKDRAYYNDIELFCINGSNLVYYKGIFIGKLNKEV